MSKYGDVALRAAKFARSGVPVSDAWKRAASEVFKNRRASREKGCPRETFLGLAENGLVRNIPSGHYTRSKANKSYGLLAVELLRKDPDLANDPKQLWSRIMRGKEKQHNQQMFVVAALWSNGDIDEFA